MTKDILTFKNYLRVLTTMWLLVIFTLFFGGFNIHLAPNMFDKILFITLVESVLTLILAGVWGVYLLTRSTEE
jgi:energy-converting hydrogenase Eha subunit C